MYGRYRKSHRYLLDRQIRSQALQRIWIRTVKAKVFVHEDGKVDFQSFVKKQSTDLEKYIRHHLAKFQVSERMLESGYIQPGEQFVQLRCMWEKLKGK